MAELQIKSRKSQADVTTLTLDGFIDAYSYSDLEKTFKQFTRRQIFKFIIDLTGVDYISSAGVGVFINLFRVTEENNGRMILINPQPKVKEVLTLLGLTQLFTIVKNKRDALKTIESTV